MPPIQSVPIANLIQMWSPVASWATTKTRPHDPDRTADFARVWKYRIAASNLGGMAGWRSKPLLSFFFQMDQQIGRFKGLCSAEKVKENVALQMFVIITAEIENCHIWWESLRSHVRGPNMAVLFSISGIGSHLIWMISDLKDFWCLHWPSEKKGNCLINSRKLGVQRTAAGGFLI
jgi:hypothetical protein